MTENLQVEIVSPEQLVFSKQADAITVPGLEGYFTIMGEHAPIMSILKPGFITVEADKNKSTFYVGGGFADISPAGITILAEETKTSADFNSEEIQAAILDAQTKLEAADGHEEISFAQATLDGFKNLADEVGHMKPFG